MRLTKGLVCEDRTEVACSADSESLQFDVVSVVRQQVSDDERSGVLPLYRCFHVVASTARHAVVNVESIHWCQHRV